MTGEEEQAAIAAARSDPRRFTPLYECYFGDIFRFLLRRAGDRDLTNDLTQETFLKAMLALPKYQERGLPFRAWLYRIALNELRMYWRKRKEVLIDLSYTQVRAFRRKWGCPWRMTKCGGWGSPWVSLDEERNRLMELRYMDGLSYLEIGQILGIGEDAAKMRTHRVLAQLRTYLSPRA